MPYSNCLACHSDKLAKNAGMPALYDSNLQDQVAQIMRGGHVPVAERQDESAVKSPLPLSARPTPRALSNLAGVPLRLHIPKIDLDSTVLAIDGIVRDGRTVWDVPRDAVGWYQATAVAGLEGNTVMAGHVAQREGVAVFQALYQVHVDDDVFVETVRGRLEYKVRDVLIVPPTETTYLRPTSTPTLTLITCAGRYDSTTHTFSHRLIVVAVPK